MFNFFRRKSNQPSNPVTEPTVKAPCPIKIRRRCNGDREIWYYNVYLETTDAVHSIQRALHWAKYYGCI